MRIFVVGATGVLGRALMPLLLQHGHIVRALARTLEQERALELAGIEAVRGDLLSPETARELPELVAGCKAVVHIATAIPKNPAELSAWDANIRLRTEGTQLLLNVSLATGVERYIQQSIVMAYPGEGDKWIDESTPLDTSPARAGINGPVITMEHLVRSVPSERLAWCILRGGSFVGPETAQATQIAELLEGRLVVPCDGSNFVSLVNVSDMAAAIVCALSAAPASSIFNIVDEPLRNSDYLDHLADLAGAPHPPRDPAVPCPPSLRCSNQAARTILKWTPKNGIWPVIEKV